MKKIHTRSKIFFPNPLVVQVEFGGELSEQQAQIELRKIARQFYRIVESTWGYSEVTYTSIYQNSFGGSIAPPGAQILIINRAYVCFQEEQDLLRFLLSCRYKTQRVKLWPSNTLFTIHEYTNDEEEISSVSAFISDNI